MISLFPPVFPISPASSNAITDAVMRPAPAPAPASQRGVAPIIKQIHITYRVQIRRSLYNL